jgi:hypothetical protein
MVIYNLDLECIAIGKTKADAPLVVDPYRMPAGAVAFECFEPVRQRQSQIIDTGCGIQLPQSHRGPPHDIPRQSPRPAGDEKPLRFGIGKRSDHRVICKRSVYGGQAIVKVAPW